MKKVSISYKKPIGVRSSWVGAGGKEYGVKEDRAWKLEQKLKRMAGVYISLNKKGSKT